MPNRATNLVLEWWQLHGDELLQNWKRAHRRQALERIEPLQ